MEIEAISQRYVLGHSTRELDRLTSQARLFEPFTRQLFEAAGIGPGMRVLDVGCGSGDVAFLAAQLVGPSGHVVGVDRAPEALLRAKERSKAQRVENVSWREGDPTELLFEECFDVIVGRLVLMYYSDPTAALRRLAVNLRPGGLMVLQELDASTCRSFPMCPLYQQCVDVIWRTLELSGARPQMGLELHSHFIAAGLPSPQLRIGGYISGGDDNVLCDHLAEVVKSLGPAIEKFGIAEHATLDGDNLAERLKLELAEESAVAISPSLIGAWSKLPAAEI